MRMASVADHLPEPGLVVEFDAGAEGAPVRHGTPPSCFQSGHFALAAGNRARNVTQSPWVAFCFDLPERADLTAMAAAWGDFIARHEALRSWYEPGGPQEQYTGWVHGPRSVRVRPRRVGEFTDADTLREHLHQRFDEATDPFHWPGHLFSAVLRESSTTCYFAIDHAYTDGHSVAVLFAELKALYREHRGGPAARLRSVHGYLRANEQEAQTLARLTKKDLDSEVWAPWREFFRGEEALPGFPADLGNPREELLPAVRREFPLLDGGEALDFRDYCRTHGGTFGAGIFAALALAQREATGQGVYRVLTAVSTRWEPGWLNTQGWLINLVPVVFDVDRCAGLADAVPLAQRAFQAARRLVDRPVHRAVELLADEGAMAPEQMRLPPMVSYLDGRATPGAKEYEAARATMLTGPDNAIGVSLWANWFQDRATVVASLPDTPQAHRSVPAHLERVRQRVLAASAPSAVSAPSAPGHAPACGASGGSVPG